MIIIGSVVGGGLFLLILVILIFCCYRRRHQRKGKKRGYQPSGYQSNTAYIANGEHGFTAGDVVGTYEMTDPRLSKHHKRPEGYENYQYVDDAPDNRFRDSRPHGTLRPVSNIMEGDAFPSPNLNHR